jgi:hypothetical protein
MGAAQAYYQSSVANRPMTFAGALAWQMPAYYALALGTLVVLWIARRYKIERRNWINRLTLHLIASFAFSTLITIFHIANDILNIRGFAAVTLERVTRNLPVYFDKVVFVYWTILLLSHAYDYYMRYQSGLVRTRTSKPASPAPNSTPSRCNSTRIFYSTP